MKSKLIPIIFTATLLSLAEAGFAQGFVNLNFESAQIIPTPGGAFYPYSIAVTDALPGWTVYFGTNAQGQITYNDPTLGNTFVTLWATNGLQLSGNYSVLLEGGASAPYASISQTGQVPASAESLSFIASGMPGNISQLDVSLGHQELSLVIVSNALNYTMYGADISAFAGQILSLTFSAPSANQGHNNWNIDNIQFSSLPIPEPGAFALATLGALFLGFCRRRR